MDLSDLISELEKINKEVEKLNKNIRMAVKVYIAFWLIAWFAFVLFWVWRYTTGQ